MGNWKVGTRIAAGFTAVIFIAAMLGFYASLQLGLIDTKAHRVAEDSLPGIYVIGQIRSDTLQNFNLLLEHVASNERIEMTRIETDIKAQRESIGGLYNSYEKTITTEKDRELFQALKSARV